MSTPATRLAVLGDPIAHSRSPQLHVAAYRALGLDWTYTRARVEEGSLGTVLDTRGAGWRGVSVTAPLKREALTWCDAVTPDAARTGAVNTIVFADLDEDAASTGSNTDIEGLMRAIERARLDFASGHVEILGAGDTAASAIVAAERLGAARITVAARRPDAADALAARMGGDIDTVRLDRWRPDEGSALIIDTIPGGYASAEPLDDELTRRVPLMSVAYDPWPTPLAAQWRSNGATVISGLDMLLYQAVKQVRLFTNGVEDLPEIDDHALAAIMRDALAAA